MASERDPLECPPDGGCGGCGNWPEHCVCTPDRSAPEALVEARVWEVLDAHGGYRAAGHVGAGWECICGEHLSQWWPEGGCRPFETAIDVAMRAHLAEALAPTVAQLIDAAVAQRTAHLVIEGERG